MASLLLSSVVAIVFFLAFEQWRRKNAQGKLPPGPRPLPIVGNILDLPPNGGPDWQHWLKHAKLYGPISSVTVFGQHIILLNDRKVASEILDRRGAQNSSRPWLEFSWGMVGFKNYTIGKSYGDRLRLHRKLMLQHIGTKSAVDDTQQIQQQEVGLTLFRMLDNPEDLFKHFRNQAGALIIQLTYGYQMDRTKDDPILFLVSRMMQRFIDSTVPGAWLVDSFPALKYLPSWLPGGGFKKIGDVWRRQVDEAAELPYDFVKRKLETNAQKPSYVANSLSKAGEKVDEEYELAVKYSAATLFGGGSDTTFSTLCFLYIGMIQYPDVLRKAQEEIDRVVGTDRLPQFSDRDHLPYIESIMVESHRWQPVVPNGVPHSSEEDQIYEGYLIPKGSALIPNVRWFSRDPSVYHDPDAFKPERYSAPYNEGDPRDYTFGFGRRVCPGRIFADSSLFLSIAQTFACFNITKGLDSHGREIEPVLNIMPGAVAHPKAYPFKITPRSKKHAELIRRNLDPNILKEGDVVVLEKLGLGLDQRNNSPDWKFNGTS